MAFCQVLISATTREEADKISNILVTERLVPGALILKGPSKYWWQGEIVEQEYFNVMAFSQVKHKDKIIEEVKKIHSDKCPIITFFDMDGNKEFLGWVKENTIN